MYNRNEQQELKTKSQRDEYRADENIRLKKYEVGLSAMTAALSAISVGVAIASLNRRKKVDPDEEPVYYMSESVGLIRWK